MLEKSPLPAMNGSFDALRLPFDSAQDLAARYHSIRPFSTARHERGLSLRRAESNGSRGRARRPNALVLQGKEYHFNQ